MVSNKDLWERFRVGKDVNNHETIVVSESHRANRRRSVLNQPLEASAAQSCWQI